MSGVTKFRAFSSCSSMNLTRQKDFGVIALPATTYFWHVVLGEATAISSSIQSKRSPRCPLEARLIFSERSCKYTKYILPSNGEVPDVLVLPEAPRVDSSRCPTLPSVPSGRYLHGHSASTSSSQDCSPKRRFHSSTCKVTWAEVSAVH